MKKIIKQNAPSILIWSLFGILSILFFYIYGNLAQDDAYITFRYAENIAQGKGFVYNPGEWVLGTTTPLYTLILAAGVFFTKIDALTISTLVNILSLWVTSGLIFELGKKEHVLESLFLGLVFITNPMLRSFVGMESYFLLCFLLLTIYFYQRGRLKLTGLCNGLLVLIRYEMIFLSLILFVIEIVKKKKFPWWMASGGVLVLVWIVYAAFVFGSPIPLSASAKLIAPKHAFLVGAAAYIYFLIREFPINYLFFLIAIVGIWGAFKLNSIKKNYLILFGFSFIYLIAASFAAGTFPWYYAPLIPAVSVLVLSGIKTIAFPPKQILKNLPEEKKNKFSQAIKLFLCLLTISIQFLFLGNNYADIKEQFGDNRFKGYKQIADIVASDPDENKSIVSFEIGYLGYYSESKIIDIAGLVSPELLPWVDQGAEAALENAIGIFSPKYIVVPCVNQKQNMIINKNQQYHLINQIESYYCFYQRK